MVRFSAMRVTTLALLAVASVGTLAGTPPGWARPNLPYRIRLEVDADSVRVPNTPVFVDLDFGALIGADVSSDSIAVFQGAREVPSQISESLETSSRGRVMWLVENPQERVFFLYFDRIGPKRHAFRDYRPPLGFGDAFYYNRPAGFDPLGIDMTNDQPMAVDWDGDGKTDLLQRNIYSYAFGEPYWGVFFWRNIGSNQNPRFDHYLRVKADGQAIAEPYATYQIADWSGDGRPDLLCGVGSGNERGTLKIFLNSGRLDPWRMSILHAGPKTMLPGEGSLSYGMRWLDWSGLGHAGLFTLRMKVQYVPVPEVNYTWCRRENVAIRGAAPVLAPPQALPLAGGTVYSDWPNDFYDWDGDGALDLIGSRGDVQSNPPHPCIVIWRNSGTRELPRFSDPPVCAKGLPVEAHSLPTAVETPAFHGLLLSSTGSWLRYFERMSGTRPAQFRDRGLLLARGQTCSSGGYASVEVADWEGDGDLDFIAGNELGYVQLIENITSSGRSMFATARPILLADGSPMRVARWNFLDDHDPEWNLGQAKPTYADWDGDGDFDLLVGNNANRVAYFENIGTRAKPVFQAMRKLTYEAGGEHFSFRKRPAVVDWNGDGLMDLVAGFAGVREKIRAEDEETVCLYLRRRAPDGSLLVSAGIPFRLVDGKEFRLPIPYRHGFEVADWDGDGDFDILTNEQSRLFVYISEGSNSQPVFRRKALCLYGTPIEISHHETSLKAVDWDKDGTLDLIAGGESGWVYFFRRAALEAGQPPKVRIGPVERPDAAPTT